MKISGVIFRLVWTAGVVNASRCRPSRVSSSVASSSTSGVLSSSIVASSASAVPSSSDVPSSSIVLSSSAGLSSSIVPSSSAIVSSSIAASSSSSSSLAPPTPSQPIGVNLIGTDVDLVNNVNGHWTFDSSNPDSIDVHTCGAGTPANGCVVFVFSQIDHSVPPPLYTCSVSYTAITIPGASYTFTLGAHASTASGIDASIYCFVSNVADPAASTIHFSLDSISQADFIPETVTFTATGTSSVVKCVYGDYTYEVAFGFSNFAYVRTA